jgi:2-haloacid dehalogenase
VPVKPAPAPHRYALAQQPVAAGQAFMVAAHDWDVAAANAAGLRSALLDRGGVRPLPGCDEQIVVREGWTPTPRPN